MTGKRPIVYKLGWSTTYVSKIKEPQAVTMGKDGLWYNGQKANDYLR